MAAETARGDGPAPKCIDAVLRLGICDDPCRVRDAKNGCLCIIAADEIARLRAEVERWKAQSFAPLGDNHHNALLCPHCNPQGLVLAKPSAPGELSPHQKAEAALDRAYAMKRRPGYEKHPDFGKG